MKCIILGGGCFWCTEAAFRVVKGVQSVISGYAGGKQEKANYKDVCSGATDHVEVIKINYDDVIITTETLLAIFFSVHDATTLNRQGNDIGTQYASVIFYDDEEQLTVANQMIAELTKKGINIVTRVQAMPEFYSAEDYHQQFYEKNPHQGYCQVMIPLKLQKLQKMFPEYFVVT